MRREPLLLFALAAAATASAPAKDFESLRAAAERTRAQLGDKLAAQERGLRDRVRTLYKLSAFGDLPLWVDDASRAQALFRRGAARRIILRDLEERRLLRAELAAIDADLARIDAEAARARELAARPLRDGSLLRPVEGDVVAPGRRRQVRACFFPCLRAYPARRRVCRPSHSRQGSPCAMRWRVRLRRPR